MDRSNQKGFSAIIIIIIVAVLSIAGLAGWYVWDKNKTPDTATSEKTTTVEKNVSTDASSTVTEQKSSDYDGWSTYTSSREGFTFKYPADWKLTDTLDSRSTTQLEAASLEASNGFTLSFDLYKLNANSNFDCSGCVFNMESTLSTKNYPKLLYAVTNSSEVNGKPFQVLSISDQKSLSDQSIRSWPYYTSKSNEGYAVRWRGEYASSTDASGADLVSYDYTEFKKLPEVSLAVKILKSIEY